MRNCPGFYILFRRFKPFCPTSCLSLCSPLLAGHILERIATEFNQLQFHAVQSKGMPLLDKVRPVSVNGLMGQEMDES